MPRGLLGVGDPDVHEIDGVATMFVGAFSTRFRNGLYRATRAHATGPWVLDADVRGRARPLTSDPPRDAWDRAGMHTPTYVPPAAGQPARIYYTGRSTTKQYGPGSGYSIGALELRDGRWTRRPGSLVRGDEYRRSVLEPVVVHDGDRFVLWYQANPHEIGPGDLPDYELRVTESEDGLTWTPPQVFADPTEGFFDNAVVRIGERWVMLLARGSNLHGRAVFPEQGLWGVTCSTASARRSDWSDPVRVLDTDAPGIPDWMGRGVYGPALEPDPDGRGATAYFTTTRRTRRWPVLTLSRLAHGRRPVIPAPFYLGLGSVRLTV